jgi:hypothetical protein
MKDGEGVSVPSPVSGEAILSLGLILNPLPPPHLLQGRDTWGNKRGDGRGNSLQILSHR